MQDIALSPGHEIKLVEGVISFIAVKGSTLTVTAPYLHAAAVQLLEQLVLMGPTALVSLDSLPKLSQLLSNSSSSTSSTLHTPFTWQQQWPQLLPTASFGSPGCSSSSQLSGSPNQLLVGECLQQLQAISNAMASAVSPK